MTITTPDAVRGRRWIPFLIGFGLLWGALALLSGLLDVGHWGTLILAVVAVGAVLVERVLFRTPWRFAPRNLGLGRTGWRPVVLAAVVSLLVVGVFPLAMWVTGTTFTLLADWPWVLVGLIAFHGFAEELVWRGYAFRRLRVGRSFPRAVLWTMGLMAVTHVPIILQAGPVVGIGAMMVAAATSIPFAYLYETGRGTIWGAVILHTAIDSFKLFVIPSESMLTFSLLLNAVSLTVPLLTLTVRRRALASAEPPVSAQTERVGTRR